MLDAAHGEAVSTIVIVQRIYERRVEIQVTGVGTARGRRRRPAEALRADIVQGSRITDAVARGRRET